MVPPCRRRCVGCREVHVHEFIASRLLRIRAARTQRAEAIINRFGRIVPGPRATGCERRFSGSRARMCHRSKAAEGGRRQRSLDVPVSRSALGTRDVILIIATRLDGEVGDPSELSCMLGMPCIYVERRLVGFSSGARIVRRHDHDVVASPRVFIAAVDMVSSVQREAR